MFLGYLNRVLWIDIFYNYIYAFLFGVSALESSIFKPVNAHQSVQNV